jgi:hypothetical protein
MSNLTIGAVVAFECDDGTWEVGCVETIYTKTGATLTEWYDSEDQQWYHAFTDGKEIIVLEQKSVKMKGYII